MQKSMYYEVFGFPCDICRAVVCADCADISPSEVRVMIMKSRSLFLFCPDCIVKSKIIILTKP
ncbi:unnamed protein product [Acanthoscelides obtectus]|uniref:Uncharacterized protein n=1 Tax=Acanthoscelides obtectus TaxID=200917 RepID=A0A9P0LJY3_ACAOB|nr:unnamed protein product [Acanthoscelides obtectus]CAH2015172.1 unnamed protein product [Acanthoscelides obtectus]CAK1624119.1 hypothetical protein AOBTE_LOCUS2332 [Acanthoscelides obtectus]CAK1624205.1 hypothetical protein AOBTE_LOCUS2400 [Acanthoscelides obtectus]